MAVTQAEWEKLQKDRAAEKEKAQNQRKKDLQDATDKATITNLRKKAFSYKDEIESEKKRITLVQTAAVKFVKDNPKPWTTTQGAMYDSYFTAVNDAQKNITSLQAKYNSAIAEINKLTNAIKERTSGVVNRTTTTNGTSGAPQGQKIQFSKDHKYNAPMVSEAYFGTQSFTNTVLEGKFVDQGKYGDAREAWKGVTGGRGTIQMDQRFLSTFTTNSFDKSKVKFELQKYGFKFLYNPTTVSMAWGLMSSMDPFYESTQMEKFQVVASSLMSSTVSFQLMLNRIKDFDYIDGTGLRGGAIPQYVNTTTLSGIQAASKNNPYPETVPNKDLAEIYNKGTMYDLEYLFKTINGPDGTFVSDLNGTTADRGWMRPTIVELHLGNSMRYRVRISEFAVNHLMFNNRMVPLLSTVTLTCSRFVDGPTIPRTDSNGASKTTSGAVTWSSSPGPSELRAAGYNR